MSQHSSPTSIIIFGASGHLTRRKLVPALFNLYLQRLLPCEFQIVWFASSKWDADEFRRQMHFGVYEFARGPFDPSAWAQFADHLHYVSGGFSEAAWRVIDPNLQVWETDTAPPMTTYAPSTWEPVTADALLTKSGPYWRHGCIDD